MGFDLNDFNFYQIDLCTCQIANLKKNELILIIYCNKKWNFV